MSALNSPAAQLQIEQIGVAFTLYAPLSAWRSPAFRHLYDEIETEFGANRALAVLPRVSTLGGTETFDRVEVACDTRDQP